MDITLLDTSLTFRMIGGVIDLYVFSGPSPANVVQQYTSLVGSSLPWLFIVLCNRSYCSNVLPGRPAMMPYWTLGFHSCRWGYDNISQVVDIVKNYSIAGIPLDTQWLDIDYMEGYRDFTVDPVSRHCYFCCCDRQFANFCCVVDIVGEFPFKRSANLCR
jgi:hypothetical protein